MGATKTREAKSAAEACPGASPGERHREWSAFRVSARAFEGERARESA